MIVPRNRLLFWVAVIVLPFALVGAVEPRVGLLSLLAIGGLVTLAVVDAAGSRQALAGINLLLPEVVRMSKDRPAKLEVRIRNERQRARMIRLALVLPNHVSSPEEDARVELPRDSEWSRFNWECVPRHRGKFKLKEACLEASSTFGFWDVRKTVPISTELRVYPNLGQERRDLAALFLHHSSLGLHAQRQIGKGREFEKLRDYIPGDSFDEIHWKATAKRGRPVTKVFQIERTQEVYVIVDASRLSGRPVAGRPVQAAGVPSGGTLFEPTTTLERYITAALVLGLAAEQQGDLFGLLAFTDKVERFVRARNGKTHYNACRDALYLLQPQVVTPDFDEVCTFIRLRLRRRALLVFLTALDDPVLSESFVRNIDLIRRQHLVVVNMLPPPGVAPVFSDPAVSSVDDLYQHLGGHLLWQNLRALEKVLQRRGVKFSLLKDERLSAQLVSEYLSVKRRQVL